MRKTFIDTKFKAGDVVSYWVESDLKSLYGSIKYINIIIDDKETIIEYRISGRCGHVPEDQIIRQYIALHTLEELEVLDENCKR